MFGVQKSPGLSDAHTLRPLSFYVKLGGREEGPYRTEDLRHLPGFTLQTLVREPSSNEWKPAYLALDLSRYFARPTPLNSFTAANSKNEISQLMSARKALRYSGTRWDLLIILFSMILWIGAFSFYQGPGQAMWNDPAMQAALRGDLRQAESDWRRAQNRYEPQIRHLFNTLQASCPPAYKEKTFALLRQIRSLSATLKNLEYR